MNNEPGLKDSFKEDLRLSLNQKTSESIEQLYDDSPEGERRWSNLDSYLSAMKNIDPEILLIGEAPGYRGTSITGVPFMCEKIIYEDRDKNLPLISYQYSNTSSNSYGYEATSTAIWKSLHASTTPLPLLWATVPNHPHEPNNRATNRKPTRPEISIYTNIIDMLLSEYRIKRIVALGNVAHETLTKMNYDAKKIRHPARGGSIKFREGYTKIAQEHYGKN